MPSQNTVYIICGRTGAGKTTLSKKIASELRAFRISHDEWLLTAFGSDIQQADFKTCCERINELIWRQVEQAITCGIDVILEGWGGRELRDQARQVLTQRNIHHQFITIECPKEVRLERVMRRNKSLNDEGFHITEEDFQRMEELEEGFGADEQCIVLHNSVNNSHPIITPELISSLKRE